MTTTTSITVRVPLKIRRRPGRKTVVTPVPAAGTDTAIATRADPTLVKALARAARYQRLLDEGRYASISEMAAGEKIDRGYLGRLLRLVVVAPTIVEAVVDGQAPASWSLPKLMGSASFTWIEQVARLHEASQQSSQP